MDREKPRTVLTYTFNLNGSEIEMAEAIKWAARQYKNCTIVEQDNIINKALFEYCRRGIVGSKTFFLPFIYFIPVVRGTVSLS